MTAITGRSIASRWKQAIISVFYGQFQETTYESENGVNVYRECEDLWLSEKFKETRCFDYGMQKMKILDKVWLILRDVRWW